MTPLTAKCKQCGGTITFRKLPNGKWCPTEPNGSDHFDVCSQRRTETFMREGKRFEGVRMDGQIVSGYRIGNEFRAHHRTTGKSITGKLYKPIECAAPCGLPPWEICACSFKETRHGNEEQPGQV